VHKGQRLPPTSEPAKSAIPVPEGQHRDMRPPEQDGPSPLPLKAFVLLLALGLITSSGLGVTIALNNSLTRFTSVMLLFAGTVVPLILIFV
jgi:hypothetical protein